VANISTALYRWRTDRMGRHYFRNVWIWWITRVKNRKRTL